MPRIYPIEKVRDIGIIAHIDAGKTTVSERILFYTGISHKLGEVHDGQAIMDWMEQERERGITITSAATTCFWTPTYHWPESGNNSNLKKDVVDELKRQFEHRINLIDTPGHIDFTVEVKRTLRVLDGAVVVFDGVAGVEPQSETNWRYADEFKVPRICFINKLDRMGGDFEKSLNSIYEKLTPSAIPIQWPIGEESNFRGVVDLLTEKAYEFKGAHGEEVVQVEIPAELREVVSEKHKELIERIVEENDEIAHKYLEGEEIKLEELKSVLRKATIENKLIPVLCGSALKNKGVNLLLDAIVDFLPSPKDLPPVKGINLKHSEEERASDDKEPFAALAFKVATDPYIGTLTFFRSYSGVIKKGTYVLNVCKNKTERIGRIVRMHANHREEVEEIYAGDLGAIVGLKDTTTGDTLTDPENPIVLEKITFPEPVISVRIEPKTKEDQEKMGIALKRLAEEDPTFKISGDSETGETIISGMGELHLEVIVSRIKKEFNVQANIGRPQVSYKETICEHSLAEGKYIRQSGGRGQYGNVKIELEPLARGKGFEFVDAIKGGTIPKEFISAVEKGTREAKEKGIIAGYQLIDFKITLVDGTFHEVDSSEFAFKIAASMALQEAAKKAKPVLLEPIMKSQVMIPSEFLGDVTGDLNSRRAKITAMEERSNNIRIVNAEVPLAEMFGYVTNLRSLTQGRGNFSMEFSHYGEAPQKVTEKIIEGRKK